MNNFSTDQPFDSTNNETLDDTFDLRYSQINTEEVNKQSYLLLPLETIH